MTTPRPFLAVVLSMVALSGAPVFGVTRYWDRGGGNDSWGTANNWDPNGVPAAGDEVILDHSRYAPAYTVNVNANTNSLIGLTIAAGGNPITLNVSTRSLNVNSGAASLSIGAGHTINQSGNTITVTGNWTNDGTFSATAGTVSLGGTAAASIGGTGATTFFHLTIGKSAAVTVSTTASFNVNGNFTCSGSGSFRATGGTVTLAGSGAATITHSSSGTTTFNNLTVSKSAAVTVSTADDFSVSGTFSNTGSGSFNATAGTVTFSGSGAGSISASSTGTTTFFGLAIDKTAAVNVSTSSDFGVNGDFACTGSGSFDAAGGTVTFGGSTSTLLSHSSSGTTAFNHLTLNKSAANRILSTGDSFTIRGDYSCAGGTFSATGGTVTMGGSGAATMSHTSSGTTTFFGLTIAKTAAVSVTTTSTFSVSGDFANSGSGTFRATGGTVTMGGSGAASISHSSNGTTTFNHLTINKSTAVAVSSASSFAIDGNFSCSGSGSFVASGGTITLGGNASASISETSSGTLTFNNLVIGKTAAVTVSTSSSFAINGGFSNTGAGTFSATGGTITLGGTAPATISSTSTGTTTFSGLTIGKSAAVSVSTGASFTIGGALTVSAPGTLELTDGIVTLTGGVTHTVAAGAALLMVANGVAAPTISMSAGGLTVNGTLETRWTTGPKPTITGTAGAVNVDLLGATVDITGLAFSNGNADGLLVGRSGGDSVIANFRFVDFSGMATNGRHLTVIGAGGFRMVCVGCTFTAVVGANGANVRTDEVPDVGAGDMVVTLLGSGGAGAGTPALGDGDDQDDDSAGGPSIQNSRDGFCEWMSGGDVLTASPGTGEVYSNPDSHTGAQGYLTAQYNWTDGTYVGNYALVRSDEDAEPPVGAGREEDLLVALTPTGMRKAYGPYRFDRLTYGRVIGPPWTATIGSSGFGADDEVIMWFTDKGYIFVVEDTGAALVNYGPYPRRPRSSTDINTEVCDTGYSLLFYNSGPDFTGGTADDRFYVVGAGAGTNQVYVTRCFTAGAQGQCVGAPIAYGAGPSRSWMAYQSLSGTEYLHIGTDSDDNPDTATGTAHVIRINLTTGAIDQEYPGLPGNHVRGGLQILDDPVIPADARIYFGCYEDAPATNEASFFSIVSDSTNPNTYINAWSPNLCGLGDVDSLAMFDEGQLYFGDSNGVFWILNRTTGATVFSPTLESGQPIRSLPLIPVDDGPIWVGNDNGKVFVVSRSTGAVQETIRLGDGRRVRSLGFVDDGAGGFLISAITSDGLVFLLSP